MAEANVSDAVERHPVSRSSFWRLMARQDRVLVPVWCAVLVLTCYASAAATPALYRSDASRVTAAAAVNSSPGIVALYGPILDVSSVGELAMTKMTVLYAVLVSVMVLFVVRRHTRGDEEAGRAELLGAAAVRATTPLRAVIVYGTGISVLLGGAVAVANTAGGLPLVG
ncbi:MAG: ABC transporter permease, partial [Actinobacteria bacterium]|nr:ABC transporter permease [Actinomycetota bacterium]